MSADVPVAAARDPLLRTRRILIAVLVLAWLLYLHLFLPAVSRGDFLLAIVRQAAAVKDGDWLYALSWPVHILGGHIVFYERVLQLFNYYFIDYSPVFVKYCAVGIWLLVGLGLYRLVERSELASPLKVVCLVGLALITFNPIPWEVLSWPDSVIPYLSSLVVLLLAAPVLVRTLNGPLGRRELRTLALLSVLIVVGSGVGWSIVAAIAYLFVVRAVQRREFEALPALAAAAAATVALAWLLIELFPQALRLKLVTESLANMDLARLGKFFLTLQGTLFGLNQLPASAWAGAGVFAVALVVYVCYKWRHREATVAELLFVFGVVSLLLVSLGRWRAVLERPVAYLPTYYHLFALPLYYGLLLMLARLLPSRAAPWAMGALFLGICGSIAAKLGFYDHNLRDQSMAYRQMLPAAQGWRMTEAARLIGETFFNQQILFDFLPSLKEAGKYAPLSRDFHPYQSRRIAPPQATAIRHSCNQTYRDLLLLEAVPDRRWNYTQGEPVKPYWRFVGAARNGQDCDATGIAVSLVAADGTVQCSSWTTPSVYVHYTSNEHADLMQSPYGFDFSCPVEGPGPYYLVTSERSNGRQLDVLPWVR